MQTLVPLLVGIPLGAAFLVVILAHVRAAARLTGPIATLAVATCLVIGVLLCVLAHSDTTGTASIWMGNWDGSTVPIGIELVCDGMSRLMIVTISLVALAAILFAGPYMRRFTKVWLFHALFLLMTGAMNGAVLAGDLFNMFVFIEVAAIASYGLVAFGCEAEELEAAVQYGIGHIVVVNLHELDMLIKIAGTKK